MSGNIQDAILRLSQCFTACGYNDLQKRQLGEKELINMSLDTNYPLYLLYYIMSQDQSVTDMHRLRAAIEFKRWAKYDWVSFKTFFLTFHKGQT